MKPIAVVRSIPRRILLHQHDLFAVSMGLLMLRWARRSLLLHIILGCADPCPLISAEVVVSLQVSEERGRASRDADRHYRMLVRIVDHHDEMKHHDTAHITNFELFNDDWNLLYQ